MKTLFLVFIYKWEVFSMIRSVFGAARLEGLFPKNAVYEKCSVFTTFRF